MVTNYCITVYIVIDTQECEEGTVAEAAALGPVPDKEPATNCAMLIH